MPKKQVKSNVAQKETHNPIVYSLILLVIQLGLFGLYYFQFPAQIPMFFSLPYGQGQLGSKLWFGIFPLFSIGMLLINSFLGSLGKYLPGIYRWYVSWTTTLLVFLITVAMIYRVLLVL